MGKVKLNFPGVSWINVCLLLSLVSIPVEHLEQTAGSALLLSKRVLLFFFFPWFVLEAKLPPPSPELLSVGHDLICRFSKSALI